MKKYKCVGNLASQLSAEITSAMSEIATDPAAYGQDVQNIMTKYQGLATTNSSVVYMRDPLNTNKTENGTVVQNMLTDTGKSNFNAAFAWALRGTQSYYAYPTSNSGYIYNISSQKGGPNNFSLNIDDANITYTNYTPIYGQELTESGDAFQSDFQAFISLKLTDDNGIVASYNPLQSIATSTGSNGSTNYYIGTTEKTSQLDDSTASSSGYTYLGAYVNSNDNKTYYVYGQSTNQTNYNSQANSLSYTFSISSSDGDNDDSTSYELNFSL